MSESLLSKVTTGKVASPRRVMIYGTHGIGKSTLAAGAEKPIFIQTEDGLDNINCSKLPKAEMFIDVMKALEALLKEDHEYKTVVVDSLDWLERLIWAQVCRDRKVKSIEDIGYAKGYTFAMTYWNEFVESLNALRRDKAMTIVLLAHCKIEKFENPETESYDRFAPRLHKHASHALQEWCDEVLFATYKVRVKQVEEGFNRTKAKGIGTGQRVMRTTEKPAHLAKNRLGLPEELPLSWEEYSKHFKPSENGGAW